MLELGLDTFGDLTVDLSGAPLSHAAVIRNLVDQAVAADAVGVDVVGVGEHHRPDFAVSAPEVVLAAIAARTCRIRLGSAVTVLSSDDPVRVYQRFATLDAVSGGRAEVILGRGSFTESFPQFGFALRDYEKLFDEKLDLFARLRAGQPLMLAIIGGAPARFQGHAELYRRALAQFSQPPAPIGVHSPGYVAATDQQAREEFWPHYKRMHDRIGAERGWPPFSREAFEREIETGSLYVGSPESVARKIAATAAVLKLDRFDLKYSAGELPHENMMTCIDLYGRRVMPLVRELLGQSPSPAPDQAGMTGSSR